MPESTLDLIEYLHVQQEQFSEVELRARRVGQPLTWNISLHYAFLTYNIDLVIPKANPLQFFRWKSSVDDRHSMVPEVYCADSEVVQLAQERVHTMSYEAYRNLDALIEGLFTEEVMDYVKIAESIAKQSYQCNAGDNYSPGYFSEIVLTPLGVHLNQINKWNSRSIDHKDDFTMRELLFFVPFVEPLTDTRRMGAEAIGKMTVDFSDQSSKNNRGCGDLIREKIHLEKLSFKG